MRYAAHPATLEQIAPLRDRYRREMNCQIVHDSFHTRPGWTREYGLEVGGRVVGYGSVVEAGPWVGKPAVYEFYVEPDHRPWALDLFEALLAVANPTTVETQTNDPLLTVMLHAFGHSPCCEKILFSDVATTSYRVPELTFRAARPEDIAALAGANLDSDARWLVESAGTIVAAGGVLYHYNPPYGDIYMAVAEPFRQRGIGTFLVQELKRICREDGHIPAARCNPDNIASRRTLRNAGFAACGALVSASLRAPG